MLLIYKLNTFVTKEKKNDVSILVCSCERFFIFGDRQHVWVFALSLSGLKNQNENVIYEFTMHGDCVPPRAHQRFK